MNYVNYSFNQSHKTSTTTVDCKNNRIFKHKLINLVLDTYLELCQWIAIYVGGPSMKRYVHELGINKQFKEFLLYLILLHYE